MSLYLKKTHVCIYIYNYKYIESPLTWKYEIFDVSTVVYKMQKIYTSTMSIDVLPCHETRSARFPSRLVLLHPLHFCGLCFHRQVGVDDSDATWLHFWSVGYTKHRVSTALVDVSWETFIQFEVHDWFVQKTMHCSIGAEFCTI